MSPRTKRRMQAQLFAFGLLMSSVGPALAHPGGHGNEAMWQACAGKTRNDVCSFESVDHDVFRGSCQAMSNALACVRNQPIERSSSQAITKTPEQVPGPTPRTGRWVEGMAGSMVLIVLGLGLFRKRK